MLQALAMASFPDYLKTAFKWHWNLLALAGGVGFALISPIPAAALAVVGAAELLYLTGMVSNPRFRSATDAKLAGYSSTQRAVSAPPTDSGEQLTQVLNQLAPGLRKRFLELRQRCLSLQSIAAKIAGNNVTEGQSMRSEGLDKLLWVHLRLLLAQQGLWRFLEETDHSELDRQLAELNKRKEAAIGDDRLLRSMASPPSRCASKTIATLSATANLSKWS
jgi:hypothetical protein